MVMTERLIRTLIERNPDAGSISKALADLDRIERERWRIEHEKSAEGERHGAAVEKLNQRLKDLRKECPHPDPQFNADPAGGHDSFYDCPVCGYEW